MPDRCLAALYVILTQLDTMGLRGVLFFVYLRAIALSALQAISPKQY